MKNLIKIDLKVRNLLSCEMTWRHFPFNLTFRKADHFVITALIIAQFLTKAIFMLSLLGSLPIGINEIYQLLDFYKHCIEISAISNTTNFKVNFVFKQIYPQFTNFQLYNNTVSHDIKSPCMI